MTGIEWSVEEMLIYDDKTFGIQEYKLNLIELYPVNNERLDFLDRFNDFLNSDSSNQNI
jgi:hypothetical protein